MLASPPALRGADAPTPKPSAGGVAGGAYAQDIPGTVVTIDMVPVPGGEFKADGKDPVAIKPLFMSKCEITWDAFDIFAYQLDLTDQQKVAGVDAKSRPSRPYGAPDAGFGHAGYATIHITKFSAEQFCEWLNKKTGRTDKKYRLPTEAEWEYAARAGTTEPPESLDAVAWYWDNADDKTHPVGKKKPNAWGLHDMLGNVMEYVTVRGDPPDALPVAAGGSYNDEAKDVGYAARKRQEKSWNQTDPQNPKSRWWLSDGKFVGFRIVCEQ